MNEWKSFTEFEIKDPYDYEISDAQKEKVYAALNARAEKLFTNILCGGGSPGVFGNIITTPTHKCKCPGLWCICNIS